jgi:hypothetical protein
MFLVNLQFPITGVERTIRRRTLGLDVDANKFSIINNSSGKPARICAADPPTVYWSDAEGMPFAVFRAGSSPLLAGAALALHCRRTDVVVAVGDSPQ